MQSFSGFENDSFGLVWFVLVIRCAIAADDDKRMKREKENGILACVA